MSCTAARTADESMCLLAAVNVPLLQSAAFFRHSFNLNAEGSSGRPLEAGYFNVPTKHLVSRGLWLRSLWGWVEAKVKRVVQLWDGGVGKRGQRREGVGRKNRK